MKTLNEFFSSYRMGKRLGRLASGAGKALGATARGVGQIAGPAIASAGKEIGKQVAANVAPALANTLTTAITNRLPGAATTPGGPATGITAGAPTATAATKLVPRGTATAATAAPATAAPIAGAAATPAPSVSGKSSTSKTITSPKRRAASVGVTIPATSSSSTAGTTAPAGTPSTSGATTTAGASTAATPAAAATTPSPYDINALIDQKNKELQALSDLGDDTGYAKAARDLQNLKNLNMKLSSYGRRAAVASTSPKLTNASVDNSDKNVLKEFLPALLAAGETLAPIAARAAIGGAATTAGSLAAQKAADKISKKRAPGEECECGESEEDVIHLKGTKEELQKVIQILKSSGILENKYNMKNMAEKKQLNELSVSGGLVGAGLGSLVGAPGLGAVIGAGLPGAVGAMKRGIKGEEEEGKKKKKKKLDPVGKEDADVDNDGKKNTPSDKYILHKRSIIAKKKAISNNENTDILNFIKCISQKNYSEANKYLQEVVGSKIKERIKQSLKK